jgi:hypothetical protein
MATAVAVEESLYDAFISNTNDQAGYAKASFCSEIL